MVALTGAARVAYLTLLSILNLRLAMHLGVTCFPLRKKKEFQEGSLRGKILIQYPVMNEPEYLVRRFVKSLNTIPADQRHIFHLQVLDDSKVPIAPGCFDECPISYEKIRRTDRTGMDPNYPGKAKSKAGNMNNGLRYAGKEYAYVAIYDVDHQVEDYGNMVKAAKILSANKELWCVQSRWVMDNLKPYSPLSILQESIMGTHIDREQTYRSADKGDMLAVMNGAGSVMDLRFVREEYGFWLERAVTEDLDISFESHAKGKKVLVKSDWITRIDNPESWGALREQWSKWSKSNGQLMRHHWRTKHPSKTTKLFWLSWLSSFMTAPLKYGFLAYSAWEFYHGINLGWIEVACLIPHVMTWLTSAQTWDNKFQWRRFWIYPLQYILELGILDAQIRGFWTGFVQADREHEFNPTPKKG